MEDVDKDFSGYDVDYSLPTKISYDIDLLRNFCEQDNDCVLTFYGGEPLLCTEEITRIMNKVRVKHFMIQTNGLLLDNLEPTYVNRLHTILVSVDGNEALTDHYRGTGTFQKVIRNLKLIRQNGFKGELIARMTVMEQTDIWEQVTWLVNNEDFPFSSVHWQLNAGFWKNDFARRDFEKWTRESYNPGVTKLVKFWVDMMENEGVVLRLYPILGVAYSFLHEAGKNLLRCGGGWINYAIQTDGYIVPCPTMWGMKDYYLGHVSTADPLRLKKAHIGKPCTQCDTLNLCGGRCLYAIVTKRWNAESYAHVCRTVRNLIQAVNGQMPRIKELINKGKVRTGDFEYMKYNGCEIIP
jgi:putative peptide-modifying radical SAM enzyme